ncbi:MAG TPA: hypothetical protein VN549_08550 [Negativicutes bacterium]|nr:hypothetical protein [Negativicutes bacterium]
MFDIFAGKLSGSDIALRREEISGLLLQKSCNIKGRSIKVLEGTDLELLFRLYDEIFLENWFRNNYKGKLEFGVSSRMTKSAGLTRCPKNIKGIKPEDVIIEIKIGIDFFLSYGMVDGSGAVGGIETRDSLEALQLVFEHELCHALEFINFGKSSCKGKRFKILANSLFGHTESCHKLPTHRQIAGSTLGIRIGDTVAFTFEGKKLKGILYRINKRATVMVPDRSGMMMDSQNKRYTKYYVPLSLIE